MGRHSLAAALWLVAGLLASSLGALSALVFFFLWLYYACTIFVFSAEIGWVLDHG